MLSAVVLNAQTIPVKGDPAKFEFATWNIEWLGTVGYGPTNEALQTQNAAKIIKDSAIDVWALQEIHPDGFSALLTALGTTYGGAIASWSGDQRTAFVYRKAAVQEVSSQVILTSTAYEYDFAYRQPFELRFKLKDGMYYRLINIHAKAQAGVDERQRRENASGYIKTYIDNLRLTLPSTETVALLGDYNDKLIGSTVSGYNSPYKNFMDDTANYSGLTTHITCSYAASCSGIDHIIIMKNGANQLVPNSVRTFDELKTAVPSYLSTTSDHVPVYGLFLRPTIADVNAEVPEQSNVKVYPNPFNDELRIEDLDGKFELLNLLGQSIQTGEGASIVNTTNLAAGFYVLRLQTTKGVEVKALVKP